MDVVIGSLIDAEINKRLSHYFKMCWTRLAPAAGTLTGGSLISKAETEVESVEIPGLWVVCSITISQYLEHQENSRVVFECLWGLWKDLKISKT